MSCVRRRARGRLYQVPTKAANQVGPCFQGRSPLLPTRSRSYLKLGRRCARSTCLPRDSRTAHLPTKAVGARPQNLQRKCPLELLAPNPQSCARQRCRSRRDRSAPGVGSSSASGAGRFRKNCASEFRCARFAARSPRVLIARQTSRKTNHQILRIARFPSRAY